LFSELCITGAIGKVFNEVLRLRLDKFLQDHNIIHESQIGFTKKARNKTVWLYLIILLLILSRPEDLLLFKYEIAFDSSFSIII
jgi:hypothetical protein